MSILQNRILVATEAADLLQAEADTLRQMMTAPPEHAEWPDDAPEARADHDRMILAAHKLRQMADDMRRDLNWMHLVTGQAQRGGRAA